MKPRKLIPGLIAVLFALSGTALAQNKAADCANTPKQIEGKVTNIDANQGRVTIRASDGTTHEFNASKETLQSYKMGDTIKASLRAAPGCESKR